MLDAALKYARQGIAVLPLLEGKKDPLVFGTFRHGYKTATTDETLILECWTQHPYVNIGLRIGFESGIAVIDEDNKGSKDGRSDMVALEKELGTLPVTRTVYTASENTATGEIGRQYYFKFPAELRDAPLKKQLADGVDVKVKNGYVVAAPSVVSGRAYESDGADIVELSAAWIASCITPELDLSEWKRVSQPRGSGKSICDEYNIHLEDVLDFTRGRKTGDGWLIPHPIHGATGKGNMGVNLSKGLWYCFRHGGGGDALTWVGVREGIIKCGDQLDRESIKECLKVLRKEGKVPEEAAVRATVTVSGVKGEPETYTVKIRPRTDVANVERFLSRHGENIRWCEETRRWFRFNGAYWKEVSADNVKHRARDVSAIVRSESALFNELKTDPKTGNTLTAEQKEKMAGEHQAWARQSSMRQRLEAIVELVKADLVVSIDAFDHDPLLYNCKLGTFNIKTGEVQPFSREDYITHYYDVPYVKGARNDRFEKFLERVQPSPEVRAFLKRAVGYSLTALTNEEALFFCYGTGSTGKSTFEAAIQGAASTYGEVSKFATFLANRYASGGSPREDITRLIGKRIVECNEVNRGTKFNGALIKTLVSGERYVARVPFSPQSVSFEPTFKLWLFANDRPTLEYDDDAAFRRFYVVPWSVVIPEPEQDKSLKDYFKNDPEAREAILAWALEGAVEWWTLSNGGVENGLRAPSDVVAETKAYQLAMNPVYQFVINECAVGCDATGKPYEVEAIRLWDVYSDIRSHYDLKNIKSAGSLGKKLKAFGFESFQGNETWRPRKWRYIRLLDPTELPEQPPLFNCQYWWSEIRTDEQIKGVLSANFLHEGTYGKVCKMCASIRSCVHVLENITKPDQATVIEMIVSFLDDSIASGKTGVDIKTDEFAVAMAQNIVIQRTELNEADVVALYKLLIESENSRIAELDSRLLVKNAAQ